MSPVPAHQDSSRNLQHLFTGQRVGTPAMGEAPVEGTVISATATQVVVTVNGFSADATFTCNYTTQYAWNGAANVAVLPTAGTRCLVAFPPPQQQGSPWVVAFFGESAPPSTNPRTLTLESVTLGTPPPAGTALKEYIGDVVITATSGSALFSPFPWGSFTYGYVPRVSIGDIGAGSVSQVGPQIIASTLGGLTVGVWTPAGAAYTGAIHMTYHIIGA